MFTTIKQTYTFLRNHRSNKLAEQKRLEALKGKASSGYMTEGERQRAFRNRPRRP